MTSLFLCQHGATGEQQPRQSNAQAQGRDDVDHEREITLAVHVAVPDLPRLEVGARVAVATTSNASNMAVLSHGGCVTTQRVSQRLRWM
jgi:hypothetical protein